MRNRRFKFYSLLKNNDYHTITYFQDNKRIVKTFKEFTEDMDNCIGKLFSLKEKNNCQTIGLLGPTSYYWMVLDHACIKGGFKSVGIPELYPKNVINSIIKDTQIDVLFVDEAINDNFEIDKNEVYYFNGSNNKNNSFESIQVSEYEKANKNNLILKDYTTVFSSGTSNNYKKINWIFTDLKKNEKKISALKIKVISIITKIKFIFSFWSGKDNKVLIFMPFSHPINRTIATMALARKIHIVLSDTKNCLKHLITEKPNIMFAVPPIYNALAKGIEQRILRFTKFQKVLFRVFNTLKINSFSNGNPIKKVFSFYLFRKIRNLYGGKGDYFVTGSAPIDPEILKVFYSVGVKVFEAYGQTESSNVISDHKNFRIGSVGRPEKGSVKIGLDGEVLLRYEEDFHGPNKDILKVKDGWILSGDLGYLDKNGFLFITGRKDELIVLENGKKVTPLKIENLLNREDEILHSLAFTKDKLEISAILSCSDGVKKDFIKERIFLLNSELADYEKIKSFYIADEKFTSENELLTSTLKIRRNEILTRFSNCKFISVN